MQVLRELISELHSFVESDFDLDVGGHNLVL